MTDETTPPTDERPGPAAGPPAESAPVPPATQPAPPRGPERARLGVISFGLAAGIVWSLFVFVVGIAATLFEWGILVVKVLSSLYIGYMPSFVGSIAGAVWAFVDGFVAGALLAWLYNKFLRARR